MKKDDVKEVIKVDHYPERTNNKKEEVVIQFKQKHGWVVHWITLETAAELKAKLDGLTALKDLRDKYKYG